MHPADLQCQTGLFKVKRPFGWALGRRQWESLAMPADAVRPFALILLSAALLSGCGENNSARQNEPASVGERERAGAQDGHRVG
jgi:hypothetical protein